MQKWEYCSIVPVKDFAWDLHYPRRIDFSEEGRKEEQLFGGDEQAEIAKTIADPVRPHAWYLERGIQVFSVQ